MPDQPTKPPQVWSDQAAIIQRIQLALDDPAQRPSAVTDVQAFAALGATNNPPFEHDGDEMGLLAAAVASDWDEAVRILLAAGADVNADTGQALREAAFYGHVAIMERLIAAGADVHVEGDRALCLAACNGQLSAVKALLGAGAVIDADANGQSRSALLEAVDYGYTDVVDHLLSAGAVLHAGALGLAASKGHVDIVKHLIAAGADIHANEEDVLMTACASGHVSVVECLHAAGADIRIQDDAALSAAAGEGHLSVVRYLLAAGADVHANEEDPLIQACKEEEYAMIDFLLAAGADASVNDSEALMRALSTRASLISRTAKIDAKYGSTTRYEENTTGIVALLRHGADAAVAWNNLPAKNRRAAADVLDTLAVEIPPEQRRALLQTAPRRFQRLRALTLAERRRTGPPPHETTLNQTYARVPVVSDHAQWGAPGEKDESQEDRIQPPAWIKKSPFASAPGLRAKGRR